MLRTVLIRPQRDDYRTLIEALSDNGMGDRLSTVERRTGRARGSIAFFAITLDEDEMVGFVEMLKRRGLKVAYN